MEAIRCRRDASSRKICNISVKEFTEGYRVRCHDIKYRKYSELGTIISCHLLADGLIRSFTVQLDYNIIPWVTSARIRPLVVDVQGAPGF